MAFLSLEEINANPIYQPPRHWIEPHPCLDEISGFLDNEKYLKEWFNKFYTLEKKGEEDYEVKPKKHGRRIKLNADSVFGFVAHYGGKHLYYADAHGQCKEAPKVYEKCGIEVLNYKYDHYTMKRSKFWGPTWLRQYCKDNGLTRYSKLNKNQLLTKLMTI